MKGSDAAQERAAGAGGRPLHGTLVGFRIIVWYGCCFPRILDTAEPQGGFYR